MFNVFGVFLDLVRGKDTGKSSTDGQHLELAG
jgi:hypothetical protein